MDTVFLTGGNGFVGLNIASQLTTRGYKVHAYVRPESDTRYLEQLPVTLFRGNLDDVDAMNTAMAGCRYVIHTAGNTSCYLKDMPVLEATNVVGTQRVVQSALDAGVERLVFTSTTSTIGCKADPALRAAENEPLVGYRSRSPYSISKRQAEDTVLRAQEKQLEVIILNLAEVVGAYDHNLQWGRMILAVRYDQVPFIPPGGGSFCSASNAALAHVQALANGRSGERYIISGADHDYAHFIDRIASQLDTTFTPPQANYTWLKFRARVYEKAPFLFSEQPLVDPYRTRVFGEHYYFDCSKAQKELGYEVATLDAMLDEAISWYSANGFLKQDQ